MNRGYIKVWRKLEESGLLQMPNTLALFMFLLLKASHKDKKVGTPIGVIELKRGEWIGGRIKLAQLLEQSEREIRTSLDRLVNLEILTIKSTSRFSVYTIVNYALYQGDDQQTTSTESSRRPADDQQTTTKQTLKNKDIYIPPISEHLFSDYKKVRKTPLTETAFKGIQREADKAGITAEQAIQICCERGWQGFKAEWINKPASNGAMANGFVA